MYQGNGGTVEYPSNGSSKAVNLDFQMPLEAWTRSFSPGSKNLQVSKSNPNPEPLARRRFIDTKHRLVFGLLRMSLDQSSQVSNPRETLFEFLRYYRYIPGLGPELSAIDGSRSP
jgi:hypothetical protein